jgi:hypothetical protein
MNGVWVGRILTILAALFLLMDAVMKVVQAKVSVDGTVQLGYPASVVVPIGLILLVCTLLYIVPQTAALGAILLTGYLGGAVATNLRAGTPLFSNILFPVYVGLIVWGGLYLRDSRVRALVKFNY